MCHSLFTAMLCKKMRFIKPFFIKTHSSECRCYPMSSSSAMQPSTACFSQQGQGFNQHYGNSDCRSASLPDLMTVKCTCLKSWQCLIIAAGCCAFFLDTPPSFKYTPIPTYLPFSTNTAHLRYIKRDFQSQLSFVSLGSFGIRCCKKTGTTNLSEPVDSLAAEGKVGLLEE